MNILKILAGLAALCAACVVGFLLFVYGPFMTPTFGDPAPAQPIPFPHNRHAGANAAAGELGLPCAFCHVFVEQSEQAGAPPLQLCMTCHVGLGLDKPGVQKLVEHVNNNEPIEWVRVHQLRHFIRFTHKRHVKAGVQCQDCHGAVEQMAVLTRVAPLQMGWCLTCHRQKEAELGVSPGSMTEDCWFCHR
ncbi:MAG: cytochrome c3 family protein [Nitrospirae bacterium]|nr:cytochrome c3 family protein [Nitrospirota bacterium]